MCPKKHRPMRSNYSRLSLSGHGPLVNAQVIETGLIMHKWDLRARVPKYARLRSVRRGSEQSGDALAKVRLPGYFQSHTKAADMGANSVLAQDEVARDLGHRAPAGE